MTENILVSAVIPARAERIYHAWLSSQEHGAMTGDTATSQADGSFTAWSGYISGKTLETTPYSRIVQSWRTTEFPAEAKDSRLTVQLEEVEGGTKVTLQHEDLPEGQGPSYEEGWHEHYFEPMRKYFASPGSRLREVGEVLEDAAEKATEAVEGAVNDVTEVVERATEQAKKTARTAGKKVKAAQKKVAAGARAFGKKVKAALAKRKPGAKKPAKKVARRPAKKAARGKGRK